MRNKDLLIGRYSGWQENIKRFRNVKDVSDVKSLGAEDGVGHVDVSHISSRMLTFKRMTRIE